MNEEVQCESKNSSILPQFFQFLKSCLRRVLKAIVWFSLRHPRCAGVQMQIIPYIAWIFTDTSFTCEKFIPQVTRCKHFSLGEVFVAHVSHSKPDLLTSVWVYYWRTTARNVTFCFSLKWPIYLVKSIDNRDKIRHSVSLPRRRSTTPHRSFFTNHPTLTIN